VPHSDADIDTEFDATVAFWRRWLRRSHYGGRWRETVHRSALTVKLLTYAPTGAIVAAPTTSLPAQLGGTRNWDYRYTWMRDAAFTLTRCSGSGSARRPARSCVAGGTLPLHGRPPVGPAADHVRHRRV
jgi:Glycosyl hydrolases family 15